MTNSEKYLKMEQRSQKKNSFDLMKFDTFRCLDFNNFGFIKSNTLLSWNSIDIRQSMNFQKGIFDHFISYNSHPLTQHCAASTESKLQKKN